jgi:hypothetical protein
MIRMRLGVLVAWVSGVLFWMGQAALADPEIVRLEPSSGLVGTRVIVIARDLFTVGDVELLFAGRTVPFAAFGSPNELRFIVPTWAACGANTVQVRVTEFSGVRVSDPVTFTVLCAAPPPGLAQFDLNGNGVIDDAEFFMVIDRWIAGGISDGVFFAVIDAWITQSTVRAGGAAARLSVRVLPGGASFVARGAVALQLEVFDTQGKQLYVGTTSGGRLLWPGSPANGVYLYVATAQGADGRVTREVGRIARVRLRAVAAVSRAG